MSVGIVMVFTNCRTIQYKKMLTADQMNDLGLYRQTTGGGQIDNLAENSVMRYAEGEGFTAQAGQITDEGLYFIFDQIPLNTVGEQTGLSELLPNARNNLYVVKHSLPNTYQFSSNADDNGNVQVAQIKEGQHESDGQFYPLIFTTLLGDNENKAERISEEIFSQLRERLGLLHQCLIPQNAPLFERFPEPLTQLGYLDNYKEFWNAVGGDDNGERQLIIEDPFDDTYVSELSKLRDAILA